jgi:hypothetical protein
MHLKKFFDRVNHDALMARVARRVKDERMPVLDPTLPGKRDHDRRCAASVGIGKTGRMAKV